MVEGKQRIRTHIVGGGIAGLTVAAALDPERFEVHVFEAAAHIGETSYGFKVSPAAMGVLRDKLFVTGLDLHLATRMCVRPSGKRLVVPLPALPDNGFLRRSQLVECLLQRVNTCHPGCVTTSHACTRVRFQKNGGVEITYEAGGVNCVKYECDLLIGADGANSVVRKYVALEKDSRVYGKMTAYRFLVREPSEWLRKETSKTFYMNVGGHIHSPCYYVQSEGGPLNVILLEYDGKPPGPPRRADLSEVLDVAERGGLSFILELLKREQIDDVACYSTFHIDCEPWHSSSAVIIGDAAHAYGPLTGKMANLAINDAYTLGAMLNQISGACNQIPQVLREWERVQRPKFEVTRTRTYRHLQLYAPYVRKLTGFLWRYCTRSMLSYFASIFAYDYEVYDAKVCDAPTTTRYHQGIVGSAIDPLSGVMKRVVKLAVGCSLLSVLGIKLIRYK